MITSLGTGTLGGGQDLFICEDGSKGRAVPNRGFGHISETLVVKFKKNPLGPTKILGIGSVDFAGPVVTESHGLNLTAEVIDVLFGREARVGAGLHGMLFRRKPEGVPSHGMQNIVAPHSPVTGYNISRGVTLEMPDMEAGTRRVGKHIEDVFLGLLRSGLSRLSRPKAIRLSPRFLPGGLNLCKGIGRASWHMDQEGILNAKPYAKSNLPSTSRFMDCDA